jgi:hypothetical protein
MKIVIVSQDDNDIFQSATFLQVETLKMLLDGFPFMLSWSPSSRTAGMTDCHWQLSGL